MWHRLAAVESYELDECSIAKIDGHTLAIVRQDDGLFAVEGVCTHEDASLADGYIEDGTIECPLHQAVFSLTTGERLEGPECRSLRTYPIRVVDGVAEVRIDD